MLVPNDDRDVRQPSPGCRMSRRYREEEEVDGGLPQLCRSGVEDEVRAFSPAMSTVSTQSHEVKHILQPPTRDREDDATSDYSHINIRPRHPDSAGPSFSRPPPPAYHHHESGGGGRFLHNRLWGSPSGHRHRFHSQVQTVSLDDVSGGDPVRRKSWSPPVQRHGAGGYHGSAKNSRSCYSSNMVDWDVGYHDNPPPYSRTTPPTNPPPYHHSSQYTYFLGQSHVQAHPISYPQGQPQGYSQGIQKHAVSGQFQGQGHVHNPVVCEESGDCLPPRLAPISGVLAQVKCECETVTSIYPLHPGKVCVRQFTSVPYIQVKCECETVTSICPLHPGKV